MGVIGRCVCVSVWAEYSDNRDYCATWWLLQCLWLAAAPVQVCVCVCEQEHVILSVTFQDLFLSELLGTGHFWRTLKCEGVDQVSWLWKSSRRQYWSKTDLYDLCEGRKNPENTASPLFLINLASGICYVKDLWWVCMFYILSAGLAKGSFFVASGRGFLSPQASPWSRFLNRGTCSHKAVSPESCKFSFCKHVPLWMPALGF